MTMSGKPLLNSCSEGLQLPIKATLKPKEMNEPKVLFAILEQVYSPSISRTNKLKIELHSMDLTSYPGENVTLYVGDAMPLVREIKMNSIDPSQHLELAIDCLKGLTKGT